MSITATVGSATANSYATLAEFDAYAATRVPTLAWFTAATDDQKEAALIAGARELDAAFAWTGAAVDEVQALCWPRSGMLNRNGFAIATTVNPIQLKNAQCEYALQLGAGDLLSDNDTLKKGITSIKAGSVALGFSDVQGKSTFESAEVQVRREQSQMRYVADAVPGEVRRQLVPGWYEEADIQGDIIFGAMGGGCD